MSPRKLAGNLLKYGLALGLLAAVVYRQWDPPGGRGLSHLWHERILTGQLNWLAFAGAWACLAGASAITIFRWGLLIRALEVPLPWGEVWKLGWVGILFNNLLPGSVGGDLVKATLAAKPFPGKRTFAVASVFFDRVMALFGLFVMSGATWAILSATGVIHAAESPVLDRVARMVAFSAVGMLLVWWGLGLVPAEAADRMVRRAGGRSRILGILAELVRAIVWYRHRPLAVTQAMVVTTCGQILFVLSFYLVAFGIEGNGTAEDAAALPGVAWHFLLVPLGMVLMAVPLFPGGLGIGEWGYGALYALVVGEAGRPAGVAASLGQRVLNWLVALLGLRAWGAVQWDATHAQQPGDAGLETKKTELGGAIPAAGKE
jgi:uncharacterized membrane protein YbhN (UPF0104 family)